MTPESDDRLVRRARVRQAFSPATPVTTRDVFAGRRDQLDRLFDIISTRGQHALVYGERGVGKTSLARVANDIFADAEDLYWHAAFYTCDTSDSFESIWRAVLKSVSITQSIQRAGFASPPTVSEVPLSTVLGEGPLTANLVCQTLSNLAQNGPHFVIFIDEFDRPENEAVSRTMADLIKILADQAVATTIVLLGVGETVSDLMHGHESVHRSLVEVQMPLMETSELAEIVEKGFAATGMTGVDDFITLVARFSLGLPHYTHLLAQQGALAAVEDRRSEVQEGDFAVAVHAALETASQSIRETYHRAVTSNRATLYSQVLLACARAEKDALGTFGAPDVRDQLRDITGQDYEIPAFAHHLNDFSGSTPPRGRILSKRGSTRRFRYKFTDPLMPPYILMVGHDKEEH